jgi:hypothetical protein
MWRPVDQTGAWTTIGCALLTATLVSAPGCGPAVDQTARQTEDSNIKRLAILYGRFLGPNRGRPPQDEAAFKRYLNSLSPDYLESLGVTSIEDLFVSERDGQAYVVTYGKLGPPVESFGGQVTMYEQQGLEGKRFVADELGTVRELAEEEFRALIPDAD